MPPGVGAGGSKSMVDFRSNEADRIVPGSGWALMRLQPAPSDQRPFNPLTPPFVRQAGASIWITRNPLTL